MRHFSHYPNKTDHFSFNKQIMISMKGIAVKFLVVVQLCTFVWGDEGVKCMGREREALLRFKNGLIDEYGILSSWGSDDCCKWYGVVCNNTTNHVISLQLDAYYYYGVLRGKVTSSLLELHHLNVLDLSFNDFGGVPIPEFIGSMVQLQILYLYGSNFAGTFPQIENLTNLRSLVLSWNDFGGETFPKFICSMIQLQHLYLSNSNFSGIVPPQIGNLTNLLSLDLSYNSLRTENLDWISSLSLLSFLDLSQIDLSHTNSLQHILNHLHSLHILLLESCSIDDVRPSAGLFVNSSSTSLSTLDLSDNLLTSSMFRWLSNMTSLVKLTLSWNALGSLIPNAFQTFVLLEYLDLSSNMFEGEIPASISNLTHLRVLSLYDNKLRGRLDELFGNLSATNGGILESLEILDLFHNQLNGIVPDLRAFPALTEVYLGYNKLTGSLPLSLGQLSKLQVIDISNNNLEGPVSESHLIKLENLKVLSLSFNSLSMQISPDWNPPFQLSVVSLRGCKMGPDFPKWIQSQKKLKWIDLSNAGISEEVPNWLWNLSSSLKYLLLSNNQINGTIPDLSSISLLEIDLSFNKLSGHIPLFHPKINGVQLSQNMLSGSVSSLCKHPLPQLYFLDLSNNQLEDQVPNCSWEKSSPDLNYLNLANNRLSGEIPHSLGSLHRLSALQLRSNNLSGELPSTLKNCTRLILIDVQGNELTGYIPTWIYTSYTVLRYLNLGSNKFYGSITPQICSLTHIRIVDMSRNNLSGEIPGCFDNFTSLANKNNTPVRSIYGFRYQYYYNKQLPHSSVLIDNNEFSSVQWKGQEKEYRKNIELLKLIDLSSNRLTGKIPESFSSMRGLISLNLSRNRLTGNIIPDIGAMEMLECLDLSHNQLSGEMPSSMEKLDNLGVLDLSNNNLFGKIPTSTQLQSFNASSYAGNDGLCGPPLSLCPEDSPRPPTTSQEEKDSGFWRLSFMQEVGISVTFGFILGFWGVVASFILKQPWRNAYFKFMDAVGDWFYVKTLIFLSKLRRS